MPTIIHFDVPAEDPRRAKMFYEELFGWKFTTIPGVEDYQEIEIAGLSGGQGIGGGLTRRTDPGQNGFIDYFGVASLDDMLVKLESLGGKLKSRHVITGYGYIALCSDTEDNVFGLFQGDRYAN